MLHLKSNPIRMLSLCIVLGKQSFYNSLGGPTPMGEGGGHYLKVSKQAIFRDVAT